MSQQSVKGIDLMQGVADKQAADLQRIMQDTQKRLKKLHKKASM